MSTSYPVHVDARLEPGLSRWLWLVKWILVIPHYLVLAFLWLAFVVLTVFAFFAILFTGRYPRSIFDFNVGVLRWTWRVSYYAYGALGTDRYPPFTLADVADYPARLRVEYPEALSRGLVLVKSWLLAVPHYLVLAFFVGGGLYVVSGVDDGAGRVWTWSSGLVGLLVLVAALVLLFTGNYPRSIFDLILGMNRWVLRVAGYSSLMTDRYPPFRLDLGGEDPGGQRPVEPGAWPQEPAAATQNPSVQPAGRPVSPAWTAGRVIAVALGSLVLVGSATVAAGGAALAVLDNGVRDDDGYLMSDGEQLGTSAYALTSSNVQLHGDGRAESLPRALLGDVKVRVEPAGSEPVFVGIAPTHSVESYLAGVARTVLVDLEGGPGDRRPVYRNVEGDPPAVPPGELGIWAAQSSGSGTQTVTWDVEGGDWTVVLMNADGSPSLRADVAAGATVPLLGWGTAVLLVLAALGLVVGLLLVIVAVRRASAKPAAPRAPVRV